MGFLATYRINRSIARLLAASDGTSPKVVQAVSTLQRFGKAPIPKLIAALAKAPYPRVLTAVLETYIQNTTLPLFGEGLASTNVRVVTGVADLLAQSKRYDTNLLLDFWTDPRISKTTLNRLLVTHQETLEASHVLRCLDSARPEERSLLFSLLSQIATVDVVPALIQRLTHTDATVRLALTRTLARFDTEAVGGALVGLLTDPHAPVRQAALEGLSNQQAPFDVLAVCRLLQDDDRAVRRQAITLLAQHKDPRTVAYLFDVLPDLQADIRQGAVDLLRVVSTSEAIKAAVTASQDPTRLRDALLHLLTDAQARVRQLALVGIASLRLPCNVEPICQLLWDPDPTIRRQATVILARLNDPHMLPVLLETLQNEAPDVQLNAIAVLNAIGNAAMLKALLEGLRDKEWWATARVTEALGKHGNTKVIDATLRLVTDADAFLRRSAVEILKLTQDEQVVPYLVDALEHEMPWVKTCAAEALAALGDKRAVPAFLHIVEVGSPDERVAALRTLTALGDAHALPVCLAQVQHGTAEAQQEAMRALATLTDAEHAEAVLQAVMTVRTTAADPELKALANSTASTLIQRFGETAVGHKQASDTSINRPALPSLLRSSTGDSQQTGAMSAGGSSMQSMSRSFTTEPMLDTTALEPDMVLGERYQVIQQIGQGGFGTVVLVEDLIVHEQLILKFLYPHMAADERMIRRFIHELRYARRVTHENVIRIHDFLKIDRAYAISMEYFPSQSLSEELRRQAPLSLPRGLWVAWQVCRGTHAAHQAQIIHRDLKPPNILSNDAGLVKIVDFGLAAASNDAASRVTKTGALLGTPLYMAPEQVQNHTVDARADIYSLGVIMYEMFTGAPPYTGDNPMAILFQHVAGKVTPPRDVNPHIPAALEAVILQAMAAETEKRFQSMDALGRQLAPLLKQYARS